MATVMQPLDATTWINAGCASGWNHRQSLHQGLFSPMSDINTQTHAFCPLKIGFPHSVQVHLQNL